MSFKYVGKSHVCKYIHFWQKSCSRDLNMVVKLHSELHFSYTWLLGKYLKVEKIQEDGLDLIPSPSVRIQIIDGEIYLRNWQNIVG